MRIATKEVDRDFGTKHYLANLPDLPDPLPQYEETNTDLLMLYPMFRSNKDQAWDVELLFRIPGAIWSKRSFLLNSDVVEKGVAIKFYMENGMWKDERVQAYMGKQGVLAKDVLTFDGTDIEKVEFPEGSDTVWMGKKFTPFLDKRLADYKFVMLIDTDFFLCRLPTAGDNRYPWVERMTSMPEDKIGVSTLGARGLSEVPRPWLGYSAYDQDLWFERAKNVLGKRLDASHLARVRNMNNSAVLFPQNYHKVQPTWQGYLPLAQEWFQSDEATTSMWEYFYNDDIYGLFSDYGVLETELDIAWHESQVYQWHMSTNREYYISHIIQNWENRWRSHIGDPSAEVR